MMQDLRAARERQFWDRYTKIPRNQGVKPPFDQRHLRRAESFIQPFPNRRLGELGPEDGTTYLTGWVVKAR